MLSLRFCHFRRSSSYALLKYKEHIEQTIGPFFRFDVNGSIEVSIVEVTPV